ncbi:RsmB/NOP family class I SAM-dependent RNA methyltransferase [candidate division KSB1 bacterium]|nr:RsmB/NOP family class I SAM-dependent RNA methyltransferase [candidate division KSB1 bacterium]
MNLFNTFEQLSPDIKTSLQNILKENLERFLTSPHEPPAIRVNTLKTTIEQFTQKLREWGINYSVHPYNPAGMIIHQDDRPLTHTLEFFCGEFMVQGISSQIPVRVLDPRPGETILDLAASPGSKSTQIAAFMQNTGRLLLCDPSINRQQPLLTNLSRAGVINDVYLGIPGQRTGRLFHEFFDRVLVDAPCSALSKLPGHISRGDRWRTSDLLSKLQNIQYHLLVSAIKAVKKDGIIVYSTCTLTAEENEQMIDRILKLYPVKIEKIDMLHGPSISPGMTEYNDRKYHTSLREAKRILPFPDPFDVFFIVKLRKTESVPSQDFYKECDYNSFNGYNDENIAPILEYLYRRWGVEPDFFADYRFLLTSKKLWLVQKSWERYPAERFVKAGLPLAIRKGENWKLSNASVQFLKNRIKTGIISLNKTQLTELFCSGQMPYTGARNGYYVLNYENENIGIVSVMTGVMKISLPHRFHLRI